MYTGKKIVVEQVPTKENFSEIGYLQANPDVESAVEQKICPSGWAHFEAFGTKEGRKFRNLSKISDIRKGKIDKIHEIINTSLPHIMIGEKYNFLTEDLRAQFGIVSTSAVSSNNYDPYTL